MIEQDPYVTFDQALALTGWSERTLYRRIEDGLVVVKRADQVSGNGTVPPLARLASLSQEAHLRYWALTLGERREASGEGKPPNLAEIPDGARQEALRRLPIVMEANAIARSREQVTVRLRALAARHQIGLSTLALWRGAYQARGLAGLLPGWGKMRGRFTALSEPIQEQIKSEYLSPQPPSPTTIYKHIEGYCEHLRIPAPSQATINRFRRSLPISAVVLAREGLKAWRAECEPKCHRDFSDLAVGEIWCGDHRESDNFVRLSDEPGAKIFRPWLTARVDLRSRVAAGTVCLVPDSDTIALNLRQIILRFGVMRALYDDNGRDYKCHYLNGNAKVSRQVGLSDAVQFILGQGVLSPLGVEVRHAQRYTPWSKPIESWFGHTFPAWERTLPGWCGADNKQRPEKLIAEIKSGALLTLEEFTALVQDHIETYNHAEHGALGCSPLSLWAGAVKEIPDARALDVLLMRHKPAKVYAQGLKLFGRYYWSDELALHVGHTVDVRYDHNEIGRLVIFGAEGESKGKFLCEAINQMAMSMHASKADLKALMKRKHAAKQRALGYHDDRRLLMDPDEALRQIANARAAAPVYVLHRTPDPEPGGAVVPRLTGAEQAASAVSPASTNQGTRPGVPVAPRRGSGSGRPAADSSAARLPGAGDGIPARRDLTSPGAPAPDGDADPTWDDVLAIGADMRREKEESRQRDERERDEIFQRVMEP
jgi:putative transposase